MNCVPLRQSSLNGENKLLNMLLLFNFNIILNSIKAMLSMIIVEDEGIIIIHRKF